MITAIVHGTSDKLRLMTDEALAYLQWLNRFAEARGLTEGDERMSLIVPLPPEARSHLRQNTHPGLLLDKYAESWDEAAAPGKLSERVQKPALEAVAGLSQGRPSGLDWDALWTRHERTLAALRPKDSAVQRPPLTLHLARASALENAGICLHPLFGFVYLPGTGLKGMPARIAETVAQAPKKQIEDVFGNTDHSGAVAFHDAWPLTWPRLIVDILNNHHVSYYQQGQAPGDWDSPVPVYFLAVPAGQSIRVRPQPTPCTTRDDLVSLAREWLAGSLIYEGAGAKTATGYGLFKLDSDSEIANRTVETVATTWSAAGRSKHGLSSPVPRN